MTVIILARATNGIVVAADGRTCIGSPHQVQLEDARKVRVHRAGSGGLVTASSGRATIGTNTTIADVIDKFWRERTADGTETPSLEEVAEHLRATIAQHNRTPCNCGSNYGKCVQLVECFECWDNLDGDGTFTPLPACSLCHGKPEYEWIEPERCPCSPGEKEPRSVPSTYSSPGEWCRCKALAESSVTLLCVPFGPQYPDGYGRPTTAVIGPNHEKNVDYSLEPRHVVVHGELTTRQYPFEIDVESTTIRMADRCAEEELVDLTGTREKVRSLLRTAYDEGKSNAVLRVLWDRDELHPRHTPETLGLSPTQETITVTELATAIREFENDHGNDNESIDKQVGVSGIGGTSTWVTIDKAGSAFGPNEITDL